MENKIINGVEYEWEDIQITLCGVPINGITSISYDSKKYKLPILPKLKKIRFPRKTKKIVNYHISLMDESINTSGLSPYERGVLYYSLIQKLSSNNSIN